MRKFMVAAIPIATLILFIGIMLSGDFLKRPLTQKDNIPQMIQSISDNVLMEQWDEAENGTKELETAWKTIVHRVQFSSERDEINNFGTCLARLKGTMKTHDKSSAIMELCEALDHWNNLGR